MYSFGFESFEVVEIVRVRETSTTSSSNLDSVRCDRPLKNSKKF